MFPVTNYVETTWIEIALVTLRKVHKSEKKSMHIYAAKFIFGIIDPLVVNTTQQDSIQRALIDLDVYWLHDIDECSVYVLRDFLQIQKSKGAG